MTDTANVSTNLTATPVTTASIAVTSSITAQPIALPPKPVPVPLTIKTAGTYSGGTYGLVTIDAPAGSVVVLDNLKADRISQNVPCELTVTNCTLSGAGPAAGIVVWRFCGALVIEHNLLNGTGGILVRDFSNRGKSVTIRYNKGVNISGATGPASKIKTSFIQCQRLTLADIEIAWNWLENKRGKAATEDGISLMISGGTPGHPALIHDNFVDGNFGYPAGSAYSGSGIMAYDPGGSCGVDNVGYTRVFNNTVLACENQAFVCAGGHDIEIANNRAVNDGSETTTIYVAYQTFNWDDKTPAAAFKAIAAHDNFSSWVGKNGYRNDFNFAPVTTVANNVAGTSTEASERDLWAAKVKAAGVTVGPESTVTK